MQLDAGVVDLIPEEIRGEVVFVSNSLAEATDVAYSRLIGAGFVEDIDHDGTPFIVLALGVRVVLRPTNSPAARR